MTFTHFSKNGQILPREQATVSLFNIEYSYGYGVYETLKVRNGIIYFVEQHLERLEHSAKIIELVHPYTKEDIKIYIQELIQQHGNIDACNIKLLLIGAGKREDAQLYIFLSTPLFPDRKLYSQGAKTITINYQRIFPHAKTLNMLGSYLAYKKALEQDCYDALLIDENNHILEGTRTNFFAITDTTLFSPPTEKVLEGVTRMTVMHVAKKYGFAIEETDIKLAELNKYDGFFITSTSTKIIPLRQINDTIFESIPENVKQLMKHYDTFLEESKGVFLSP
ncbi:MAG TPA: aminotransferase class IV [Candidatus Saccharimonadales bacterium]|nr:aminotransferase class IV [Candidatus Saccharimonadales bacterium]